MEGEVEADAGVVDDAGKTNFASEPPSGSNHTPSAIGGPVDIDYTALGPEQVKLVKLLDDRGAFEGIIDNSTGVDVKVMELAGVFHDERDKIIDFLLTDCEQGNFRRKTLQEYDEKEEVIHRLVYWQHYGSGNKFVEFLLDVKIVSPDKSTNIIELAPLDEDDLSDEAAEMLVEILASIKTKTVKRGVIKGKLSFTDFEFGQTAVTMVGTLKAEERVTETKPEVDVPTVKTFKSARSRRSSVEGRNSGRTKKGDVKAAYAAVKGITEEVGKQFRQAAVIDERRKAHFVEKVMPNVPTLTEEEDRMLESVAGLEEKLYKKGKRVKGTLKEGIDKFLWRKGDNVWAAFGVTVDKSAKVVLAEEFLLNTFALSEKQLKNNGNLPWVIRNDFEGTRSMHCHAGIKVPAATNRLFENWYVWKEVKLENGRTSYMLAFVPLTEYAEGGFKDLSKEGFVLAETTGVYFFNEIAPNVCRVTRVQTVDLKFTGLLQKTLMDKAVDYLAKSQLIEANRLKEMFRRNGKGVDAEVRGALVDRMREGAELEEDQKKVFGEVEELFGGEDEEGWGPLESPYEGVEMQIMYKQQKKGKKTLTFGRAECITDCSAEEAAAWFFEYCSRERMAVDRQEGNPARLEIMKSDKGSINEKVFVTVKNLPFPFHKREFVMRYVWQKGHQDDIMSIAFVPAEEQVDYGENLGKLVKATTSGILTAKNIQDQDGVLQCKLTLTQFMDTGGYIPVKVVDKSVPYALGAVAALRDSFKRDEEVDKAALASLASIIKNELQDYTDEEKVAIRKGKEFYEKCKEGRNFEDLKSPDERVKMKLVHVDGTSSVTGFATTVVDASVEECAANEIVGLESRDEIKKAKMNGLTTMKVVSVNPHTLYYITTREFGFPGLSPRDSRSKITWSKQDDGKVIIDVADTEEVQVDFLVKAGNVLMKVHTVWVFEPLGTIGDMPQTSVTFTTKVELGGVFYSSIMKTIAPRFLGVLSTLRKKFDRSRDIDASTRIQIISGIGEIKEMSTETFDDKFLELEGKQKVKGAFPLSDTWIKVEEKGKGWGKTTVTVRADLEEAAAYFWDFESRVHQEITGDVERVVEEKKGTWEVVVRRRQKLESQHGGIHRDREFWNVMKLQKVDEDNIVIIKEPIMEKIERSDALSKTQRGTAQRASEEVAIKFTKRGEKVTKVEFVTKVKLGSSVIVEATRSTLERHLDEAAEAQRYFIDLVPLMEMSKQVGEALGADLVWDGGQLGGAHSRKDRERHVGEVCNNNIALREVVKKYPWFVTLLKRARLCEFSSNSSVSTKLECVEEKEARVIGNNLMPCLKSRKVIKAGVDMWRLQNRAVGELFEEFPWMEGMFVEIGKGVVKGAPWGLFWRVTVGAFTSMFDLLTDVYVTYMFWRGKKYGYFKASLASLALRENDLEGLDARSVN